MGPNFWNLVIILLVVVLLFGTKKLRNIGQDLGGAIKGFKDGIKDADKENAAPAKPQIETPEQKSE